MTDDGFDLASLRGVIVSRRQRLGWTTGRLAERSGLPDPYLRRIENGKTGTIGLGTLQKLATGFGTTVDDLLAEAGVPTVRAQVGEIDDVYRLLGPIERRAWLRMGHTLKEIQAEYAALQAEPDTIAAFSEEDLAQEDRRESEDFNGA